MGPDGVSGVQPSPFLKWAGGKSRLLEQYEPWWPEEFERYHEPFLGGGAVFFRLRPEEAALSDVNGRLVDTWRAVRDSLPEVLERLAGHRERHGRTYFYRARQRFNAGRGVSPVERAALMIYLNKTCFNGLYRENGRGEFNVPIGSYRDPRIFDVGHLRAVSRVLQGVEIRVSGFESVVDRAEAGDLVYFDPPYVPLSATSAFTGYHASGFGMDLQHRLARVYAELDRRGCRVMLSNSDVPAVRELYAGWRIIGIRAGRSISCKSSRRGSVGEVLVRNW
ncbi:MAG: DNA adenine methylase [Deltaproteobacteria bacterium]|nr:MAG: DNA adenine methylase [Deltaproteobacteria bacterium]